MCGRRSGRARAGDGKAAGVVHGNGRRFRPRRAALMHPVAPVGAAGRRRPRGRWVRHGGPAPGFGVAQGPLQRDRRTRIADGPTLGERATVFNGASPRRRAIGANARHSCRETERTVRRGGRPGPHRIDAGRMGTARSWAMHPHRLRDALRRLIRGHAGSVRQVERGLGRVRFAHARPHGVGRWPTAVEVVRPRALARRCARRGRAGAAVVRGRDGLPARLG